VNHSGTMKRNDDHEDTKIVQDVNKQGNNGYILVGERKESGSLLLSAQSNKVSGEKGRGLSEKPLCGMGGGAQKLGGKAGLSTEGGSGKNGTTVITGKVPPGQGKKGRVSQKGGR